MPRCGELVFNLVIVDCATSYSISLTTSGLSIAEHCSVSFKCIMVLVLNLDVDPYRCIYVNLNNTCNLKVTLLRVSRCPWARHLTLTAPDELAVAVCGWLRRRCVNVCMNGRLGQKRLMNALNINIITKSWNCFCVNIMPTLRREQFCMVTKNKWGHWLKGKNRRRGFNSTVCM